MDQLKLQFLMEQAPALLSGLDPEARGQWGLMNGLQMTGHLIDSVLIAAGKSPQQQFTPEARIPAMREFLLSEKPFREYTKNPLLPDQPLPPRFPDMPTALASLKNALQEFQDAYATDPERKIINPFYGPLNYAEQVQLLHKHVSHHLRQFGLV